MSRAFLVVLAALTLAATPAQSPAPPAPVPQADTYVAFPGAAFQPSRNHSYRALFDGTRGAENPGAILPVLVMTGDVLNDLGATGVPLTNAKLAVVFHGDAVDGILDDAHYRAKFRRGNPNLPVLAALRRNGVELYVCGQYLAAMKIPPASLAHEVKLATDAELVLIELQNRGYALMSF
jgi:intracellular sulfur oxidation DsrE/DsrF family protein